MPKAAPLEQHWWLVLPGDSAALCCGWEPGVGQGSVVGPDHTCRAQDGGASETLFSLAQEDRDVCLFSVLSFTWRLFCLSSVSGDKMT